MNAALAALVLGAAGSPLTLWHAYRGDEETALRAAAQAFTRTSGVDVELLGLPYDAYPAKLTSAIPHGAGPDVFVFAHERALQFSQNGLIVPARDEDAAYLGSAVEALRVDGQRVGYPLALKCIALFVNTDLVREPPSTTNDLLALLPALSNPAEGRYGLAYEAGDFYFHAPLLFGFGGTLFDAEGRAQFESAGMTQSLAFVRNLLAQRFMPEEASGALITALFNQGRVAMVISGPWLVGELSSGLHYRVVPLPVVSVTGQPARPFLGVEAAYVSSGSSRLEAAHALAAFLAHGEAAVERVRAAHQVPAFAITADAPAPVDPVTADFARAAALATPTPNTLEMARVWEPMKLALRGVLQGGVSPEEGGALATRRYQALYRPAPPPSNPGPWWALLVTLAAVGGVWAWRRPRALAHPGDGAKAAVMVGPALAGFVVLIAIPLLWGVGLAFFHHDAGNYTFVGAGNFVDLLGSKGFRITEPLSFYFALGVTLLWTVVNVALHVTIGIALALLLKNPLLRLRGFYRVLLIVPWAVPNYVTALMWKGIFHRQFGALNALLAWLGIAPVAWFAHFSTAFAANVVTNTWLGFPFMMVVALGALQSIPPELYEAADVDGASAWVKFKTITLPMLRPGMLPAVLLGTMWTFNMFNVIYLVSGGEPAGATDILVSEAYRWAFQRHEQYGFAAAYSVLIFFVLWGWSRVTRRLTEGTT